MSGSIKLRIDKSLSIQYFVKKLESKPHEVGMLVLHKHEEIYCLAYILIKISSLLYQYSSYAVKGWFQKEKNSSVSRLTRFDLTVIF